MSAARRVASLLRRLAEQADLAMYARQGTVNATHAGPPRTVDVELSEGEVPEVPLLTHHTMPSVSDTVWIERVRPGGWIYKGEQG